MKFEPVYIILSLFITCSASAQEWTLPDNIGFFITKPKWPAAQALHPVKN